MTGFNIVLASAPRCPRRSLSLVFPDQFFTYIVFSTVRSAYPDGAFMASSWLRIVSQKCLNSPFSLSYVRFIIISKHPHLQRCTEPLIYDVGLWRAERRDGKLLFLKSDPKYLCQLMVQVVVRRMIIQMTDLVRTTSFERVETTITAVR